MEAMWRLGRRPELDVVRGIAILLVLVGHTWSLRLGGIAEAGVSVFFALSGFLITALLLQEHHDQGRVAVRAFYMRRVRRLVPALAVFIAVMLLLGATLSPKLATPRAALPVIFYVENFAKASGAPSLAFGHTWSLSLEEQFYATWPLVLLLAMRRRGPRAVFLAASVGLAASVAVRLTLTLAGATSDRVYYGTDTNACLLLAGCVAAAWLHGRPARTARPWIGWLLLAVTPAAGFLSPFALSTSAVVPLVAAAVTAVALVQLVGGNARPSRMPAVMVWFGRRSYGIYLWHFALLMVTLRAFDVTGYSRWVTVPILTALLLLVAEASWRLVEQPFQRHRSPVAADATAGLGRRVAAHA